MSVNDRLEQLGERFSQNGKGEQMDAAMKSRELESPAAIDRALTSTSDNDVMSLMKEGGISKEDLLATTQALHPRLHPVRQAAFFGVVGAALGAVSTPLMDSLRHGKTSWQAFAKAAPKSTALGLAIGAVAGVGITAVINRKRDDYASELSKEFDGMESGWAAREAKRKMPVQGQLSR